MSLAAGGFSAALTRRQEILLWGEGQFGTFPIPQRLYMDKVSFKDIHIGKFSHDSFAIALQDNGKVFAWGSNQLG